MAHYAFVNEHGVVVEVIVGSDETETINGQTGTAVWEQFYAEQRPGMTCRRTSFNGNIRKNYAGVGYTYDQALDAFIAPQPFPSWTLNEDTCVWEPPVPYPADGTMYVWDEATQSWLPVS